MPDTYSNQIDETLRKRFEASWASGNPAPIEECLPTRDGPSYLGTLAELVHIEIEFAWKTWSRARHEIATLAPGDVIDRPAPVDAYLEKFPDLNQADILLSLVQQEYHLRQRFGDCPTPDEYRSRFPQLNLTVQSLDTQSPFETVPEDALSLATPLAKSDFSPHVFGDYKLLEEIGRGGMGVVYRAHQQGTDRVVALKVIRADRMQAVAPDSQSSLSERFRHEAQAAARLTHENIVTVYEVGQHEGKQYYSMRFIEGPTLAQVLRDGPLPNQRAAQYIEAVARAVSVAHEADILHRDIKPQNIMLDTSSDRVLVADFGLAKLLSEAEQLTLAGEVVGTPNYMAPEQARDAASVTAAADIYGLGATLYHLLTGRPPFQAATPVETLRQVMDDDPVALSLLNRAVDRDLETICLKCLLKDPSRRYASAQLMADDLARYLRHEPITARPISTWGRTTRWCRRNPTTAAWIAAAVASLWLALVASLAAYLKTSAALAQSEDSYRQTRATVDYFYTQASENVLLNVPGLQPLRHDLLRQALNHYQQFVARRRDDPSVQVELGRAHFRVAAITEEIDSASEALVDYERARDIQQAILAKNPSDIAALQALGNTLNAIGRALRTSEKLDEALIALHKAKTIRTQLTELDAESREFKRTLANTVMNIGIVQKAQGNLDAAQESITTAQKMRTQLLAAVPRDTDILRDLGMGYYNLGTLKLADKQWDEAEGQLTEAVAVFKQVCAAESDDLANRARLATCCRILGHVRLLIAARFDRSQAVIEAQETRDKALANYECALSHTQTLADRSPHVVDYQHQLAAVHLEVGRLQIDTGNADQHPDRAAEHFKTAKKMLAPLAEKGPALRRDYAVAMRELAVAQLQLDQFTAAQQNLTGSREHLQLLTTAFPDNPDYASDLMETQRVIDSLEKSVN